MLQKNMKFMLKEINRNEKVVRITNESTVLSYSLQDLQLCKKLGIYEIEI